MPRRKSPEYEWTEPEEHHPKKKAKKKLFMDTLEENFDEVLLFDVEGLFPGTCTTNSRRDGGSRSATLRFIGFAGGRRLHDGIVCIADKKTKNKQGDDDGGGQVSYLFSRNLRECGKCMAKAVHLLSVRVRVEDCLTGLKPPPPTIDEASSDDEDEGGEDVDRVAEPVAVAAENGNPDDDSGFSGNYDSIPSPPMFLESIPSPPLPNLGDDAAGEGERTIGEGNADSIGQNGGTQSTSRAKDPSFPRNIFYKEGAGGAAGPPSTAAKTRKKTPETAAAKDNKPIVHKPQSKKNFRIKTAERRTGKIKKKMIRYKRARKRETATHYQKFLRGGSCDSCRMEFKYWPLLVEHLYAVHDKPVCFMCLRVLYAREELKHEDDDSHHLTAATVTAAIGKKKARKGKEVLDYWIAKAEEEFSSVNNADDENDSPPASPVPFVFDEFDGDAGALMSPPPPDGGSSADDDHRRPTGPLPSMPVIDDLFNIPSPPMDSFRNNDETGCVASSGPKPSKGEVDNDFSADDFGNIPSPTFGEPCQDGGSGNSISTTESSNQASSFISRGREGPDTKPLFNMTSDAFLDGDWDNLPSPPMDSMFQSDGGSSVPAERLNGSRPSKEKPEDNSLPAAAANDAGGFDFFGEYENLPSPTLFGAGGADDSAAVQSETRDDIYARADEAAASAGNRGLSVVTDDFANLPSPPIDDFPGETKFSADLDDEVDVEFKQMREKSGDEEEDDIPCPPPPVLSPRNEAGQTNALGDIYVRADETATAEDGGPAVDDDDADDYANQPPPPIDEDTVETEYSDAVATDDVNVDDEVEVDFKQAEETGCEETDEILCPPPPILSASGEVVDDVKPGMLRPKHPPEC